MKSLITLATLTFMSFAATADYPVGAVKPQACGQNTQLSTSHSTRFGYVGNVRKAMVQGLNVKTPLYTIAFVSNRGERTTYVYAQLSIRPLGIVPPTIPMPSTQFKPAATELQIIGTVEHGSFNRIYFLRAPNVNTLFVHVDRFEMIATMSGNLTLLDGGSYPFNITSFVKVFTTM